MSLIDHSQVHTMQNNSNHQNSRNYRDVEPNTDSPSDGATNAIKVDSYHTVSFWDKSLRKDRLYIFRWYLLTLAMLCTFILAVLSLYWAVFYNVEMNLNSLIVYIVNFDEGDVIGPALVKMSESMVQQNKQPHLGYITVPSADFANDPLRVRESVLSQDAWAAMIVNPNATHLLRQAVERGNASYDPLGACQMIYVQARDQDAYASYILPQLNLFQTQFTSMLGKQWATSVLSNTSISREALQRAPQAVSPAIGFSIFNLRPFEPLQATPAVSIGLIYLIIISFFAFSFFMPIHNRLVNESGRTKVPFWQMILWRYIAAINSYLFLSLAYSLVSLVFQVPFSRSPASHTESALNANPYDKATFIVYWMLNFIGMTGLGLACENVAMVIGFPWTAMWLIFWVITNVSTSFYPIEIEPHFFYWGYAWPLHNIVEGSRTLVFGLHSRLGLNFGVLFAWAGIGTLLYPICSYFMRRREARAGS